MSDIDTLNNSKRPDVHNIRNKSSSADRKLKIPGPLPNVSNTKLISELALKSTTFAPTQKVETVQRAGIDQRTETGEPVNQIIKGENTFDVPDDDDNGSVLVIILQCETKPCDQNIINLKWLFSDPFFTVQVCAVDPPINMQTSKNLTTAQYTENYFMRKALNYAAEGPYLSNSEGIPEPQFWWNKIPVIIVKDSSISNIAPSGKATNFSVKGKQNVQTVDTDVKVLSHPTNSVNSIMDSVINGMKKRIKVSLEKAHQADLFFLCKWNDACNKYVDVNGINSSAMGRGSTLKWSTQPTATQAIMYTPKSRDYIRDALMITNSPLSDLLNANISQGKLAATVFVPNLIDFDIDLATSKSDFAKLNECAPVPTTSETTNNTASLIWFGIIIIIVILIAWALVQFNPAPSTM